jgi:hypothetical protein
LQAQASFWRAQLRVNDPGSRDADMATARRLIDHIGAGLPEKFRSGFRLRPDMRVISGAAVR